MARTYQEMTKDELLREQESLLARYKAFQAKGLQLDMSRGKPCKEQLDLSVGMNDVKDYVSGGVDVRNYGILDGIASCKQLFAELLEVPAENVIIGPNESLTLMFDFICQCYTHGIGGKPWSQEKEVKILCPVPGYDRHFTVCQYFGLQMVNVPMNADGPDMDTIEELVKDPSVKGMFCVPKYSNPTGITFSDAVVRRIAALRPAAEDFRIVWDNAYCVHDLDEDGDKLLNIFDVLPEYGNEDMVIEVASTSKITFPGAGVSCLVASKKNLDLIRQRLTVQTISYLPHFISWVVCATLMFDLMSTDGGAINEFLMWIGVIKEPIGFFTEGKYFWGITLCTDIWKELGWNAIIFISAITSISQDMYEAADIDGATRAQKMWHITIKSIKPTIILMFIFQVGGILNANFDQIMMLTKQMGNSMLKEYADVLDTFIYRLGVSQGRFSFAAAAGLFKSIVNFALLLGSNYVAGKFGEAQLF